MPKKEVVKETKVNESEENKKKSNAKVYHVTQRKDKNMWQVKLGNGEKALKFFKTQKEALAFAKEMSEKQNASYRLHGVSGKIRKD